LPNVTVDPGQRPVPRSVTLLALPPCGVETLVGALVMTGSTNDTGKKREPRATPVPELEPRTPAPRFGSGAAVSSPRAAVSTPEPEPGSDGGVTDTVMPGPEDGCRSMASVNPDPKLAVNGCWNDEQGASSSRGGTAGDQTTSFVTSTESVIERGAGPTPAFAGVPSTVIVRVPL